MKLYIKQRVFSIGDKYDVCDEWGNPVYHVESQVFAFLDKIHIFDMKGKELFFIKRKMSFFGAIYEIYNGNILCAQIQQRIRFLRSQLDINSQYGQFTIEGDFFSHDFSIYNGNTLVGTVQKAYFSWGDSYQLDISSYSDPAFFTTLVIAIDNCLHNEDRD